MRLKLAKVSVTETHPIPTTFSTTLTTPFVEILNESLVSLQGISVWNAWDGWEGKTTVFKRMCCAEYVTGRFVGGACFMKFGESATLLKVREEICRCVRKFGG